MSELNVALLGCGGMGASLIKAAAGLPGCRVDCVADPDLDRAQALATELGAEALADPTEALARESVGAVIIAAPNFLHPPLALQAAQAGKHIFCEKPMALTGEDARAMIAAAQTAGVKLMIGQVLRYLPPYCYILDLIRGGELGRPFCAQITRIGGPWTGGYRVGWRMRADQCGGPLFEINAHEIDFMRLALGAEVCRVHALAGNWVDPDLDYADTVQVLMQFDSGAQGSLLAGHSAHLGTYDGKFYLTGGTIYFDAKTSLVTYFKAGDEQPTEVPYDRTAEGYEGGVQREVREFVEAVQNDTPVTIPGEEGLQNTMIAQAAHLSAERGAAVDLPV